MIHLLAQIGDPTKALAGDSGWYGVGLLGLVLGWVLFINIPGKDKLIKEHIENKDKALDAKDKIILELVNSKEQSILICQERSDKLITGISEKFDKIVSALSVDFKCTMKDITQHCKEELAITLDRLKDK